MTLQQPIGESFEGMSDWITLDPKTVAKAISELTFEECLAPCEISPGQWELPLPSEATYRFAAVRRSWEQLLLDSGSLTRNDLPVDDAVAFFADARETLGMSAATFCTYAKELYNTLAADMRVIGRPTRYTATDLAQLSDTDLQALLEGHPKAPANKGRLGWGRDEADRYAPEAGESLELFDIVRSLLTRHVEQPHIYAGRQPLYGNS